jgi:hypothetical protein
MKELKEQTIELLNQYAIMLQLIYRTNAAVSIMVDCSNMFSIVLKANCYSVFLISYCENLGFTLKIYGLPRENKFMCDDLLECKKLIDMYFDHIKNYYIRVSKTT